MDETNEEETPVVEEPAAEGVPQSAEVGRRKGKGGGFFGGLLSGAAVGGALALLLAPLRGEQRAGEGTRWQSREEIEQEGVLRARVVIERVQAIAGGIVSGVKGAWAAVRERLREAAEETREGMAEGQAEARARYEFMTKRRRPRR
jgi:gas vesicle protein